MTNNQTVSAYEDEEEWEDDDENCMHEWEWYESDYYGHYGECLNCWESRYENHSYDRTSYNYEYHYKMCDCAELMINLLYFTLLRMIVA